LYQLAAAQGHPGALCNVDAFHEPFHGGILHR
jgi:hypothetical protein